MPISEKEDYSRWPKYIKPEQPNMDRIKVLSKEFNTTLTATAIRYVQLSIEPCAIAISKDRNIKWYKKSKSFDFHVKVGKKVSPDSYAFDFYDGIDLPDKPMKASAHAWFTGDFDEDAEIFEHSIGFYNYGVVISLLWVNDDIRPYSRREDYYERNPEFDLSNPFTPDGKRWRW